MTICICGHPRAQHKTKNDGRRRLCAYAADCRCRGYERTRDAGAQRRAIAMQDALDRVVKKALADCEVSNG